MQSVGSPDSAQPLERPAAAGAPVSSVPGSAQRIAWVPIRSLGPVHRPRILEHLLALSDRDRYLRFGCLANDAHVARYVAGLNFDRDEIYGVFNRRLKLVALAHLACASPGRTSLTATTTAEFGGSVLPRLRGRGYGAKLFEHAMLHARNRGIGNFYIHALSENAAMLRIARNAGATVQRDGPESEAFLKLPPETLASHVEQAVIEGAAALDYQFKQQARIVDAVVSVIGEVRDAARNSRHSSAP
jgi:GNAT superfamily N-acetyltransferase